MAEGEKPDRITIVTGEPIRRTATGRLGFTKSRSRDKSQDRSDIQSVYDEAFEAPRESDFRHRQVKTIVSLAGNLADLFCVCRSTKDGHCYCKTLTFRIGESFKLTTTTAGSHINQQELSTVTLARVQSTCSPLRSRNLRLSTTCLAPCRSLYGL
jgi:hypothetical protein